MELTRRGNAGIKALSNTLASTPNDGTRVNHTNKNVPIAAKNAIPSAYHIAILVRIRM